MFRFASFLLLCVAGYGCSSAKDTMATESDAGTVDAGTVDGGAVDGGTVDGGALDAGEDAGQSCTSLDEVECYDCLCAQFSPACTVIDSLYVSFFRCGQHCGATACEAFCLDPANTLPDPACDACFGEILADPSSFPDEYMTLETACQADQDCAAYAAAQQSCR